jgi:anti-sigma factor RsiW
MNDQFTFDAASYVLGALSPAERAAFEEHMRDCAACRAEVRDFSDLPGLLSQLPADDPALTLPEEDLEPPAALLPSLLLSVRRERRQRRWRMAAAAGLAAACLAGLGSAVVVERHTGRPAPAPVAQALTFQPATGVPVRASATVEPEAWGTEVHLSCTYTGEAWAGGAPHTYALVAVDKSGKERETLGTWLVLPDKEVTMTGATALSRDQLSRLEIRTSDDRTVLSLSL